MTETAIRPTRGCQHFGTMRYAETRAECLRCGATWFRDLDGPWRVLKAGVDPPPDDQAELALGGGGDE